MGEAEGQALSVADGVAVGSLRGALSAGQRSGHGGRGCVGLGGGWHGRSSGRGAAATCAEGGRHSGHDAAAGHEGASRAAAERRTGARGQ